MLLLHRLCKPWFLLITLVAALSLLLHSFLDLPCRQIGAEFQVGGQRPIPRYKLRDLPSLSEVDRLVLQSSTPVIIEFTMPGNKSSAQRLSFELVQKTLRDVQGTTTLFPGGVQAWGENLEEIPYSEALRRVANNESIRVQNIPLPSDLRKQFLQPARLFRALLAKGISDVGGYIYAGAQGAVAGLHIHGGLYYSEHASVHIVHQGTKNVVLYPYEDFRCLYIQPWSGGSLTAASLSLDPGVQQEYPALRRASAFHATLRPWDVLYMPARSAHEFHYTGKPTLAVDFSFPALTGISRWRMRVRSALLPMVPMLQSKEPDLSAAFSWAALRRSNYLELTPHWWRCWCEVTLDSALHLVHVGALLSESVGRALLARVPGWVDILCPPK